MPEIRVRAETVPILSVTPYEGNARRGNVAAIAESLQANGQYRPIVCREEDRTILAGNHTWQAARHLGMPEIAVTWISCDDVTARKIVLADNRTGDLSDYDNSALLDLLRSLPDLDGTGFALSDIDRLDGLLDTPLEDLEERDPIEPDIALEAGSWKSRLDPDMYASWRAALDIDSDGKKAKAQRILRARLQIPTEARKPKQPKSLKSAEITAAAAVIEPLDNLVPYPMNARQGDVGAIAESLKALGQYRPITVNRSTREILVGNHTYLAALSIGMTHLAVTWVDVDEDRAKRIVLADNRTSDLAFYHDEQLGELLKDLPDLSGTGFDGDDLDAILAGDAHRKVGALKSYIRIADLKIALAAEVFIAWAEGLPSGDEIGEIARRAGLPPESLVDTHL